MNLIVIGNRRGYSMICNQNSPLAEQTRTGSNSGTDTTHQHLINNTQRSWDKNGCVIPPHLPSTYFRDTDETTPNDNNHQGKAYSDPIPTQPPPTQTRIHIQFDSASKPYDVGQNEQSDHGSELPNQPGLSAFKIS